MNNKLGRKLTSLTLMTIMFAGGMTLAIPGMTPAAVADQFSSTDGYLTVSSTYIQGGAVLEVVINDPQYAATDVDINAGPDVTLAGTDYIATQGTDGKWYAYFVDYSTSSTLDALGSSQTTSELSMGFEYGTACPGLGTSANAGEGNSPDATSNIIGANTTVWAAAYPAVKGIHDSLTGGQDGACNNIDGAPFDADAEGSTDYSGASARPLLTDSILANAPAMSQWDTSNNNDGGQRNHILNGTSGQGSWPFIFADYEFASSFIVEYGPTGDSIEVEFGNTDDETTLSLTNESPAENHEIHITIDDPALNIDPTTADVWMFDLTSEANFAAKRVTNGSNTWLTDANMISAGFISNGDLVTADLDGDGSNDVTGLNASQYRTVNMTESSANSGKFESFDTLGNSSLDVKEGTAGDTVVQFKYGGNSVNMVVTYNDASMTLEHDGSGDWIPGQAATVTIVDPDLNKNPTEADELTVGDPLARVPTIKVGSPMTLKQSSTGIDSDDLNIGQNDADNTAGQNLNESVVVGDDTSGGDACTTCGGTSGIHYTGHAQDTFDHSERLRITFDGASPASGTATTTYGTITWINVTTSHTVQEITDLPGTVVLSYDVSGPAGLMTGVTGINVYLVGTSSNATNTSTDVISLVTSGAATSGVVSLCVDSIFVCSEDMHAQSNGWTANIDDQGEANANVAFKFTHAASAAETTTHGQMNSDSDFAIAADICNFDQDNGTDTHNCIYRIEAEETGDNTGVFTGTVEYIQLNNSSNFNANAQRGSAAGNDHGVADLIGTSDIDVTVVLMDAVDGTSSIRISHNDTDALGAATEVQKQLDAFTHTGTVELDANVYGADDMATITIVDPDLNMDSELRDTYANSSGTFQVTFTDGVSPAVSSQMVGASQTIIETGLNTGVFVGTFTVPNQLGEDMEVVYYESADAAGEALEFYATSTIASNDGDVSLSKSVYPVPFNGTDLYEGDDTVDSQAHTGNVTATITVSEPDNTADTLTVATANKMQIKLIHGTTTTLIFNAGNAASASTLTDSTAIELGPLTETERGSMEYEVDMVIQAKMCGPGTTTAGGALNTLQCVDVKSGDVVQVQYEDASDSAGATSTFYDSSTFDLRASTLTTDKDVYVIGSDMVVTLTDPDLNVDAASIETYTLNLIEWDSDADGSELMNDTTDFTANPSKLQETGSDTGVFQSVITIPKQIIDTTTTAIDFGEAVTLTYVDTGIAGEDDYLDDRADVEATFSISNFGALVELDKAVYGWKDTVYITITAPDHNQNTASEETIGTSSLPIQVTTRNGKMCTGSTGDTSTYEAVESDEDTGVFVAEVTLAGFSHTMSSDTAATSPTAATCGTGDTDGVIQTAGQTDGVSVSFEYNDGDVVVASASIAWVIGEASFDTSAVSAGGSAVLTVTDNDENQDTTVTDTFKVDVYSDSDNGGFKLVMNETDEDTGVFEGTVYFTSETATSGSTLRVSEGDTVTAEYTDETLPEPYTSSDDLVIAASTTVGTAFPPLERAPAANARVVDAFGASVASVSVDQQVQIAADVANGQSNDQGFAYIVQVQDGDGVTVSLAWITGSLTGGQSMSPALSWTPSASGSYTATVFVWESVDNPTALSPTVSVDISVN